MSGLDDREFAQSAVKARYTTSVHIEECLEIQRQAEAIGVRTSLSEILFQRGHLTEAQVRTLMGPPRQALPRIPGYDLLGKIGEGGMGEVYKARQISLDRLVAIKVIRKGLAEDPHFVQRFQREAKACARLRHPNVVAAYDVGETSGVHFFVMEFVEGESLRALLLRSGRLEERQALTLVRQIAEALGEAARHKLVHRDIKPENILVTPEGTARLTDLGLVKSIGGEDDRLTQSGATLGTPLYLAPEQVKGEECDTRTDLYSLGATLFETVTGGPPYEAPNHAALLWKHINAPIPAARERCAGLSAGVEEICQRLLAKLPDDRYQTSEALVSDIDKVLGGRTTWVAQAHSAGVQDSPPGGAVPTSRPDAVTELPASRTPARPADGRQGVRAATPVHAPVTPGDVARGPAALEGPQAPAEDSEGASPSPRSPRRSRVGLALVFATLLVAGALAVRGVAPSAAPDRVPGPPTASARPPSPAPAPDPSDPPSFPEPSGEPADPDPSIPPPFLGPSPEPAAPVTPRGGDAEPRRLEGSWDVVYALAFSPDGTLLASGSRDKLIKLWDPARAKELRTLEEHTACVSTLAFDGSGRRLVSGSHDRLVKTWDPSAGTCLLTLNEAAPNWGEGMFAIAVSADGTRIAAGGQGRSVRVWNATNGDLVWQAEGHTDRINSLAFDPRGRWLVSASDDHAVRVWDVADGKAIATLTEHAQAVKAVALSGNGERMATAGADGVRLWDTGTWAVKGILLSRADRKPTGAMSVAFSPRADLVASGGRVTQTVAGSEHASGALSVWDVASGEETERRPLGDLDAGAPLPVAFSPSGLELAVANGRTILIWPVPTAGGVGVVPATWRDTAPPSPVVARSSDGRITITSPLEGEVVKSGTIRLSAVIRFRSGDGEVNVEVNGSRVFLSDRGIGGVTPLANDPNDRNSRKLSVDVPLSRGENVILVRIAEKDGSGDVQTVKVACDPPGQPIAALPRIWAVVAGVGDYADPDIRDLAFAERDAAAMAELLRGKHVGVPPERMKALLGVQATREAFISALDDTLTRAAPEDAVIIYLAVHGVPDPKSGEELYLLFQDARKSKVLGTGFEQATLEKQIRTSSARKVVLLLDACHAGSLGGGVAVAHRGDSELTPQLLKRLGEAKDGVAVLSSCSANQYSYEDAKWGGGHGVFTFYLLEALQGAADKAPKDGFVTPREAYDFVYSKCSVATDGKQRPLLTGNFDESMPLSIVR